MVEGEGKTLHSTHGSIAQIIQRDYTELGVSDEIERWREILYVEYANHVAKTAGQTGENYDQAHLEDLSQDQ
jgi:hypothetical protein